MKKLNIFDIGLYGFSFLSPIFFFGNWNLDMIQKLFFVFGVFTLLALSFLCKKERIYNNKWLGLIVLWALLNVFIHSFSYSLTQTYAKSFINFSLMSEGFIYVLCGCLLFYLVVTYSKKFNIAYPLLAINILNLIFCILQTLRIDFIWVNVTSLCGMMGTIFQLKVFSALSFPILCNYLWKKQNRLWMFLSLIPIVNLFISFHTEVSRLSFIGILALVLGLLIYLWKNKQMIRFYILLIALSIMAFPYREVMWGKFLDRLSTWAIAFKQFIHNPIIGVGWDNSMYGNMIPKWVVCKWDWLYIQNDYLNVARDLGLPFLLMIMAFVYGVLKNKKVDYLWLSIVILLVACFMQTSLYYPRIASIGLILLALKECQRYEETRNLPKV